MLYELIGNNDTYDIDKEESIDTYDSFIEACEKMYQIFNDYKYFKIQRWAYDDICETFTPDEYYTFWKSKN